MEDIIVAILAPICPRLWRIFASVNRRINARLLAAEDVIQTYKRTTKYTNGVATYTITAHDIKHGPFTVVDNTGKCVVEGNYRLGLLHGTLTSDSRNIKKVVNYYNGQLHGVYKVVSPTNKRDENFKYGKLHGHSRWEEIYTAGRTRVVTGNYVDGIVHGREESFVMIGDKTYPTLITEHIMGRIHGRAQSYNIVDDVPGEPRAVLTFDAEYEDGKLMHEYPIPDSSYSYRFVKRHGRTYYEEWRDGHMTFTGRTTPCWRIDELVMINDSEYMANKVIYETRNRNQNGFYMIFNDHDKLIHMYTNRQYVLHGPCIQYNTNGRAITITNYCNGLANGASKIYVYNNDDTVRHIVHNNIIFGYDIGTRLPVQ